MSLKQEDNLKSDSQIKDRTFAERQHDEAGVKQDWWSTFFHGVAVDMWKSVMTAEQTRKEADFIQNMLRLNAGDRVLDVPCGNGRLARELAARGLYATGVDIAAENIAQAQADSAALEDRVFWKCGDMRDLPWKAAFDGAFCFGNSFGYLREEENEDFLTSVAAALKPGAGFLIDHGCCAEALLPHFQERKWYQIGDITFLSASRYDAYHSRLEIDYTFIRNGKMDTRPASQRVYSCGELCRLAKRHGFADFNACGSLEGEPFRLGSSKLLLLMKKE